MKVNDYVRTANGYIGKIFNINEYREPTLKYGILTNYIDMVDTHFIGEEDIAKSSPNIIDLIEIGDIITFKDDYVVYNVIALPDEEVGLDVFYLAKHYDGETEDIEISKKLMQKYIYSIVTKEQFERCEYKI